MNIRHGTHAGHRTDRPRRKRTPHRDCTAAWVAGPYGSSKTTRNERAARKTDHSLVPETERNHSHLSRRYLNRISLSNGSARFGLIARHLRAIVIARTNQYDHRSRQGTPVVIVLRSRNFRASDIRRSRIRATFSFSDGEIAITKGMRFG